MELDPTSFALFAMLCIMGVVGMVVIGAEWWMQRGEANGKTDDEDEESDSD